MSTSMILKSRLAINPAVNLIKNVGVVEGATHSGDYIRMIPHRYRKLFELENYELEFPLCHPKYMIRDVQYEQMHDRYYAVNWLKKLGDDIERIFLYIRYGQLKQLGQGIKRRIQRHGK